MLLPSAESFRRPPPGFARRGAPRRGRKIARREWAWPNWVRRAPPAQREFSPLLLLLQRRLVWASLLASARLASLTLIKEPRESLLLLLLSSFLAPQPDAADDGQLPGCAAKKSARRVRRRARPDWIGRARV